MEHLQAALEETLARLQHAKKNLQAAEIEERSARAAYHETKDALTIAENRPCTCFMYCLCPNGEFSKEARRKEGLEVFGDPDFWEKLHRGEQ